MAGVYGIQAADEWLDIESYYKEDLFPEWLRKGWIPIASDGCGGYFVVATRASNGLGNPIFFVAPSRSIEEPDYVAASDLWHFLRFYLGHEFGERDWPHNRDFVLAKDPELVRYTAVLKAWEVEE